MLRECRRVLIPGGRLVFDVVSVPGTVSAQEELDGDYGFVATQIPYLDLLARVGFTDFGSEDTTLGYLKAAGRWLDAARDLEPELRNAMGDDVFDDKYTSRAESYEMIRSGKLGRTLYWATR